MAGAIRTSDLRSRFLHLAQTSVYQVKLQPPTSVVSHLAREGFNYSQDGENVELLCEAVSLPGTSLSTHEVIGDYHGVRERMAYRRMYDATTDFTFYVDHDYKVIEFFDGWMDYISGVGSGQHLSKNNQKSSSANYRMNYPDSYMTNVFITKFEKDVSTSNRIFRDDRTFFMNYTFVQAFPLNIVSIPVAYAQSDILRVTVSMAYQRYVREKRQVRG